MNKLALPLLLSVCLEASAEEPKAAPDGVTTAFPALPVSNQDLEAIIAVHEEAIFGILGISHQMVMTECPKAQLEEWTTARHPNLVIIPGTTAHVTEIDGTGVKISSSGGLVHPEQMIVFNVSAQGAMGCVQRQLDTVSAGMKNISPETSCEVAFHKFPEGLNRKLKGDYGFLKAACTTKFN